MKRIDTTSKATIKHVKVDPEDQKKVEVILKYGANKPLAEHEFNSAFSYLMCETPMRVICENHTYDVLIEDGKLVIEEGLKNARALDYTLILKGEIVNEQ